MDKPIFSAHQPPKRKKGFALLVTLSVLVVIIALVSALLSYFDEVRKESSLTKALIQGNLYYTDIQKTFKKFPDKKALYEMLYMAPIPFTLPDSDFSVTISCSPMANGVNINWLRDDGNETLKKAADRMFESVVLAYDIESPNILQEMLMAEVGDTHRFVYKEEKRLLQNSGIASYRQFEQVLNRYQAKTDDSKAGNVPWKEYFVFNPYSRQIESQYLSAEFIALYFDMDLEQLNNEWEAGVSSLKETLAGSTVQYDQKLFSDKFAGQSTCEVLYSYEGENYGFGFVDINGEVKHFEFHGNK